MLPLAEWINGLTLTERLREVAWFGAMINVMHLLALVVFFGALLIVDLRLMGGGLTKQPLPAVARHARPWLKWGFFGLVLTGIPQLMLAPVKEYYSGLFWFKMEVMLVAIVCMPGNAVTRSGIGMGMGIAGLATGDTLSTRSKSLRMMFSP